MSEQQFPYIEATTFGKLPIGAHFVFSRDQGHAPTPWREIAPVGDDVQQKVDESGRQPITASAMHRKQTHAMEAVIRVYVSVFRKQPHGSIEMYDTYFSPEHRKLAMKAYRDACREVALSPLSAEDVIKLGVRLDAYHHGPGFVSEYDCAAVAQAADSPAATIPEQLQAAIAATERTRAMLEERRMVVTAEKLSATITAVQAAIAQHAKANMGVPNDIDKIRKQADSVVAEMLGAGYRAVVEPRSDWTGVTVRVEQLPSDPAPQ